MGYEEVETVLPADFVPKPDPVPEQPQVEPPSSPRSLAPGLPPQAAEDSDYYESEAEDAGCTGMRKKKKKKRTKSSERSGRKSMLSRWKDSRSKSRGRRSKKAIADGNASDAEGGDAKDGDKKKSKRSSKSGGSKLSFRAIRKVDSNATEVRSNTSKSKEDREKDGAEKAEDWNENAVVNDAAAAASGGLPTVREGSPANTTITSMTDEKSTTGDDKAKEEEEEAKKEEAKKTTTTIASPSPAPTTVSTGEFSIEVGDENEGMTVAIESPFNKPEEEAAVETEAEEAEREEPAAAATSPVAVDDAASVKSNRSIKSKKSGESIKAAKSSESIKASASGEKATFPDVTAAASGDAASLRSSKSNRSTASAKSTSSKRSLRSIKSLKSKSKSIDEDEKALVVVPAPEEEVHDEARDEENPAAASSEAPAAAPGSPQKSKWVKKVSLSIGGYKTSFQFSDPMANFAEAVNDALDVVGKNDANLVRQAKQMDNVHADDDNAAADADVPQGEEEERDYDVNPTRLFMYLQQRAWGLALTQLQKHPEEARVWVYRKAKLEKAPNVHDADSNPKAVVVQHTALVVHDGSEMARFRWKLLPLHAAIVLGAPTEIIQDVIRAYPAAARKADERGSLPVHLAASRLDVDPEGEKVVLQLFGAYPDSIEVQDRKGRTPPELAKLARARKDIEVQRRQSASASQAGGQECTASQYGKAADHKKEEKGGDEDGSSDDGSSGGGEDDDDRSVQSSLSGRFQNFLRKSKSTDTVDRRKKKVNKKKKTLASDVGLGAAKSMDAEHLDSVDDATIAESLGPGFAFLKTSKSQEVRDAASAASRQGSEADEDEEDDDEPTEEEMLVAAKKAMVSKHYELPQAAPHDIDAARSIPLPMSFSMKEASSDDSSIHSSRSNKSARSARSTRSSPRGSPMGSPKGSPRSSPKAVAGDDGSDAASAVSAAAASVATSGTKSVKISMVHETAPQTSPRAVDSAASAAGELSTSDSGASDDRPESERVNAGLRLLLEKAAENAGRAGLDVTKFVKTLEDEWVTDVEALRRLDGETLDELLPLMLSRELQRLINHADSIDTRFLSEDKTLQGSSIRGRSPKKSSKKKKKKRSHRKIKKRSHYRAVTPPDSATLTPIVEEGDSPASTGTDEGAMSIVTEARTVYTAKSAPPKLQALRDNDEDESDEEEVAEGEEEDEDINQSASVEDLEIRKLHANLIADARKKFPTREALEDSIRERQAEVEAAVNFGFDVDKQTLARAALADDEVRKLLPLRLILPTIADLNEMIMVLQMHKEDALRVLDVDKARSIAAEIDEVEEQIKNEERYLMQKRMGETKCASCGELFPTEKKQTGILKTKEKKCPGCRGDGGSSVRLDVETVDSRDDDN